MLTIGAIVIAVGVAAIAVASGRGNRPLLVFGWSVVFTLAAWIVWSILVSAAIVPLDPIAHALGMENPVAWVPFMMLAPPLLAGLLFACVLWYVRSPPGG
jgi:hypothetical protein